MRASILMNTVLAPRASKINSEELQISPARLSLRKDDEGVFHFQLTLLPRAEIARVVELDGGWIE
jgi:hypothetical protein